MLVQGGWAAYWGGAGQRPRTRSSLETESATRRVSEGIVTRCSPKSWTAEEASELMSCDRTPRDALPRGRVLKLRDSSSVFQTGLAQKRVRAHEPEHWNLTGHGEGLAMVIISESARSLKGGLAASGLRGVALGMVLRMVLALIGHRGG